MSASDDRTVKLWDLSNQESSLTLTGHQDYVRCGAFMPGQNSNLLVTGSYDQTVKLWDPRVPGSAAMTFKFAASVEAVLPLPSGTGLVTAAENQISIIDLVAAKPIQQLRSHQKTVTSLCLASNGTRLVSGGLDGHMKVFDSTTWNVVAGSKYASPILSLSVVTSGTQQEDKHLVVGLQSGLLSIKTRLSGQQKVQQREREKEMQALMEGKIEEYDKKSAKKQRTGGVQKKLRGLDYDGNGAAIIVEGNERQRRKKLPAWDRALRKVQYSKALDLALGEEAS